MKFSTHHFPVGTVFELSESIMRHVDRDLEPHARIRVCTGLVQNGIDSYVINTGRMKQFSNGEPHAEGFNIDHVACIIKRGQGPIKIDHLYFGSKKNDRRIVEDIAMMDARSCWPKGPTRRNVYYTGSLHPVLMHEVGKIAASDMMIDYGKMCDSILAQAWCVAVHEKFLRVWSIDKKPLRKFLRANLNRFLVDRKAARKANDKEEREYMERDMAQELGYDNRRLSLEDEDAGDLGGREEGSCYSEMDNPDYSEYADRDRQQLETLLANDGGALDGAGAQYYASESEEPRDGD